MILMLRKEFFERQGKNKKNQNIYNNLMNNQILLTEEQAKQYRLEYSDIKKTRKNAIESGQQSKR